MFTPPFTLLYVNINKYNNVPVHYLKWLSPKTRLTIGTNAPLPCRGGERLRDCMQLDIRTEPLFIALEDAVNGALG